MKIEISLELSHAALQPLKILKCGNESIKSYWQKSEISIIFESKKMSHYFWPRSHQNKKKGKINQNWKYSKKTTAKNGYRVTNLKKN